MKKIICLMFVALIVSFSLITAFAHGGRTDDNGGHYDRDTGEYHYHHGHPAHQHANGECPYDYNNSINTQHSTYNEQESNGFAIVFAIVIVFVFLLFICLLFAFFTIRSNRKNSSDNPTDKTEISNNQKNQNQIYVNYKRETDTPETTLVSKYSENSLYKLYVVGKDIPQGNTEFTARGSRGGHITIFTSNDSSRQYIDFKKPFYVDLKDGQKVEVFNCRWKSIQNDRSDNQ